MPTALLIEPANGVPASVTPRWSGYGTFADSIRYARIIVGTWRTRADWEAWHNDPDFTVTRGQLEGLEAEPSKHWWHEVIEDVRGPASTLDEAA